MEVKPETLYRVEITDNYVNVGISCVAEGFSNDMSTEDMIEYLKQHHDKKLHPDYLNHLISTNSKFVLKNIPINSIRTELSGLDRAKVEQYKQMDFSKAPPIVVGSDGNILDGYHRANVAKALGISTIKAYVGVKGQQGVAEGSESLDYQGNCTEDDVVDDIFGDVNNFANMVEKYGDEFTRGNLVVKYDPKKDVHYFYYKKQGCRTD